MCLKAEIHFGIKYCKKMHLIRIIGMNCRSLNLFSVLFSKIIPLPKTALGSRVLDRFIGNMAAMDIPELKGHRITISLGAVIVTEPESFSSMYEKADSLMYDVKKKDGNAYMFFS